MRRIAIVPKDPVAPTPIPGHRARARFRVVPTLLVIGALWWASPVAIPVVLSLLISYALQPLVTRLESCCLPRVVAVPLVLLVVLALLAGGMYSLRGEAAAFANRLPDAAHAVAQAVRGSTSDGPGPFSKLRQAAKEIEAVAQSSRELKIIDGVQAVRIEEPTFRWNEWIRQGSHGAVALAIQLFAIVCLVYYILLAGESYKQKIVRFIGQSVSDTTLTTQILTEIDGQIE